jgi:outer membrane protein assembly factor BamB
VGARLGLALPFLLLALMIPLVALGCAQLTTPAAQHTQTPSLTFVFDGNFLTAKNNYDLRITLVALASTDGHVAWQSALPTSSAGDAPGFRFQPVSQNGAVYVGYYYDHPVDTQNTVRHGVIEALDAATGRLRWRRELGTELNGAPVVDGATVYVSASVLHAENQQAPTESGLVAALDTQTGAVRWQRALDAPPSMVASAAGRVYLIMSEQFAGHALALNANDGSSAWDYASDAPLTRGGDAENGASSAPLVVDGRVLVEATERAADGSGQLKLVALNAENGHTAWQHQTQGIAATPAINQGGDTICLSDYVSEKDTSDILGLAVADGSSRWSVTAMPGIVSGCTASGDSFYLTQRASAMKSGTVFTLNSQDGKQLWKTATAAPVAADGILAPTAVNSVVGVYLVDDKATSGPVTSAMAVFNASDGKLLWKHVYDGRPDQTMDIEGDLIFNAERATNLSTIAVYDRATGAPLWSYTLGKL